MGTRFKKKKKRIKLARVIICILILTLIIRMVVKLIGDKSTENTVEVSGNVSTNQNEIINSINDVENEITESINNVQNEITEPIDNSENKIPEPIVESELGWELTLVNSNNPISDNYELTLVSIDEYRKFDSRAIKKLQNMLNDIWKNGITNIWVQSAYRSVDEQTRIYNEKVEYYKKQGKTEEESKKLTERTINKPGYSEHNLGLAVDFNYVDSSFENTNVFKWLKDNAENYGFVLKYPKEKEDITQVTYEPWHWRYVGEENAKKMNELGLCLEEYVEYLNN